MALATNAALNLYKGKGICSFKASGQSGWLDLGEVTVFENTPEITKTPFYTSRSGTKLKLFDTIDEQSLTGSMTLLEMTKENLALALFAGTPTAGSQSAGTLDAVSTTTITDRFIETGKLYLYHYKLMHGTAAGGTPANGDTVTGVTSAATCEIVYKGSGYIEVIKVVGTFVAGETIGNGTWTAVLDTPVRVSGAIVCSTNTGTARYTKGTDYDEDSFAGTIRENTGSAIVSHTSYVSADYEAKTLNTINILSETITQGELKFIGHNDQGVRFHVWYPNATLSADGAIGLISEDNAELTLSVEILADAETYPDAPYGTWTEIS